MKTMALIDGLFNGGMVRKVKISSDTYDTLKLDAKTNTGLQRHCVCTRT